MGLNKAQRTTTKAKAKFLRQPTSNSQRMESMNTALQQQRLEVEQLRREAAMKRIPVSQAVEDIKRYAMEHMMQDHLIVGFASEKANPFREKTWSCELI